MEKEKCPCCDNKTLSERDNFEICPICGWEDDNIQGADPNYCGGANGISLNLARDIYSWGRTGTCPLCQEKSLSAENRYEKCPVCGWIDDPLQRADRTTSIGANPMSRAFANVAWHNRQSFGLLHGKGWDECADSESEILTLEPTRKKPLELLTCPCCGHTSMLTRAAKRGLPRVWLDR
jgi:Zn finger protein HypA/HybF involved in hydrogenase expression